MNKRNSGIDILRGLCILAVILLHLNIHFGYTNSFLLEMIPKKIFSLLFWSGYYGVIIFFTLSGYLITSSIINKWGTMNKIDLKAFYWFRFSRIAPLLIILLILLSVLHLAKVQGFVIDPTQTSLLRALFAATTFHINWLEIQVGYLPGSWDILWSISIEETFYLIFPLVCLFITRDWQLFLILVVFLIVSPWARTSMYIGNELADKNHLAYIDSLGLGCLSAVVATRMTFPRWISYTFLMTGFALVALVVYFRKFVFQSGLTETGLHVTILSVGIGLILLHLHDDHRSGLSNDRWSFKWLKQMGIYSYEIYLTHMFVVVGGVWAFKQFELDSNALIPVSLLIIFASYLLGKMIFIHISEPINLRLRKIYDQRRTSKTHPI